MHRPPLNRPTRLPYDFWQTPVVDEPLASVLGDFLKTADGACCKILGMIKPIPEIHGQGTGIGVRKEDTDLKDLLNKGLAAIRANGKYKEINDKYFKFDVYGAES